MISSPSNGPASRSTVAPRSVRPCKTNRLLSDRIAKIRRYPQEEFSVTVDDRRSYWRYWTPRREVESLRRAFRLSEQPQIAGGRKDDFPCAVLARRQRRARRYPERRRRLVSVFEDDLPLGEARREEKRIEAPMKARRGHPVREKMQGVASERQLLGPD